MTFFLDIFLSITRFQGFESNMFLNALLATNIHILYKKTQRIWQIWDKNVTKMSDAIKRFIKNIMSKANVCIKQWITMKGLLRYCNKQKQLQKYSTNKSTEIWQPYVLRYWRYNGDLASGDTMVTS